MAIGHPDTFGGQLVHVRRFYDRISIASQVAIAQIISQKYQYIGLGRHVPAAARQQDNYGNYPYPVFHSFLTNVFLTLISYPSTFVVPPPFSILMSIFGLLVFQAPAVKSGILMEFELLSTDH